MLNYYKTLIRLRKENPALHDGGFNLIDESNNDVLAFVRTASSGKQVLVALNFTAKPQLLSYRFSGAHAKTLISSFSGTGQAADLNKLELPAFGCYVGEVEK